MVTLVGSVGHVTSETHLKYLIQWALFPVGECFKFQVDIFLLDNPCFNFGGENGGARNTSIHYNSPANTLGAWYSLTFICLLVVPLFVATYFRSISYFSSFIFLAFFRFGSVSFSSFFPFSLLLAFFPCFAPSSRSRCT